MFRFLTLSTFLCASAIASAMPATVAPRSGTFRGHTSQHRAMSIGVSHGRVTRNSFDLRFRCSDGYRNSFTISKPRAIPIVGGAFNQSWSGTSGLGYPYTVTLAGSFPRARRAVGTISLGINRPDHGGGCSTGRLHWTATHR